jgi:hypothetical protein
VRLSDALIGGLFALSGVVVQQILATASAHLEHRRARSAELLAEKRSIYARLIVAMRVVQRLSKDHADAPAVAVDRSRITASLDVLAQVNAEVRLVASSDLVERVLAWEDVARCRLLSGDSSATDELRISTVVCALRRDLFPEGTGESIAPLR